MSSTRALARPHITATSTLGTSQYSPPPPPVTPAMRSAWLVAGAERHAGRGCATPA